MEQLATKIVSRMIIADIITSDDADEYRYSIQIFLERILSYALIMTIAVAFRCFISTLVFSLSFAAIRTFSGGYHCKSYISCLVLSTVVSLSCGFISPLIDLYRSIYQGCAIMSIIIVFIVGSVNNHNIDWSAEEYRRVKALSRLTLLVEISILLLIRVSNIPDSLSFYISYGIVACAISILIEIRKRGGIAYEVY